MELDKCDLDVAQQCHSDHSPFSDIDFVSMIEQLENFTSEAKFSSLDRIARYAARRIRDYRKFVHA